MQVCAVLLNVRLDIAALLVCFWAMAQAPRDWTPDWAGLLSALLIVTARPKSSFIRTSQPCSKGMEQMKCSSIPLLCISKRSPSFSAFLTRDKMIKASISECVLAP